MTLLFAVFVLIFLWVIHRSTDAISDSVSDYVIKYYFGIVSCIIPAGFIISFFNGINTPLAWGVCVVGISFIQSFIFRKIANHKLFVLKKSIRQAAQNLKELWFGGKIFGQMLFIVLISVFVYTTIINLLIFIFGYPNEWDSMTGHLVKCAYYLQNGSMNDIGGTTWSIDYYPNAIPSLQVFFYHLLGEHGFKVIHFLAYWAYCFSIFGISKHLVPNYKANYFVFFVAALLPTALIQATNTETDLILTAQLSCILYFVLKWIKNSNKLYSFILACSLAIWVGLKVTFILVSPAVLVVLIYVIYIKRKSLKDFKAILLVFSIATLFYVLPTGYLENLQKAKKLSLGAISAPELVMQWHGVESYTAKDKVKNFELNILRYSSDFLQFDGIRNIEIGKKFNDGFRALPNLILDNFNLEQDKFWAVAPFKLMGDTNYKFYIERPFWGIISFGMVLPLLFLVIFNFVKNRNSRNQLAFVLLVATIAHFMSLCFSAPYDPIKGRYFMNMAIWCLPCLAIMYDSYPIKSYLFVCSVFIGLSAIGTVSFRRMYPIFEEKNIFTLNRFEQESLSRPELLAAFQNFDKLVPQNAVVALGTQQEHEDFEYPFFGKNFSRKLIPIHPFRSGLKPIPNEAEYLLYTNDVFEFKKGDIQLNNGDKLKDTPVPESIFYLRKLK
jgi:hypothetical protein